MQPSTAESALVWMSLKLYVDARNCIRQIGSFVTLVHCLRVRDIHLMVSVRNITYWLPLGNRAVRVMQTHTGNALDLHRPVSKQQEQQQRRRRLLEWLQQRNWQQQQQLHQVYLTLTTSGVTTTTSIANNNNNNSSSATAHITTTTGVGKYTEALLWLQHQNTTSRNTSPQFYHCLLLKHWHMLQSSCNRAVRL